MYWQTDCLMCSQYSGYTLNLLFDFSVSSDLHYSMSCVFLCCLVMFSVSLPFHVMLLLLAKTKRCLNTALSPALCPGVCRLSGYPILGNQRQERHQCGAGLHDHGCWNKEEDGSRGNSRRRGEAQREADPWHYCQAFIRRMLLREKPLPLWPSLPAGLSARPPPSSKLHCVPAKAHHNRQDREDMSHNMCMWEQDEVACICTVHNVAALPKSNKASFLSYCPVIDDKFYR